MRFAALVTGLAFAAAGVNAADPDRRVQVGLDIYNRDQALVREVRRVDLEKGVNQIDFTGIAPGIYGHTASLRPLKSAAELQTHSVTYFYDLADEDKLLTRYLGRWFSFATEDEHYSGRLLHFNDDHLFLQPDTTDPMLEVVARGKLQDMFYPRLPENLFLKPTLRWVVDARKARSDEPVELTYLTTGVTWWADYRAEVLSGDTLELSANFTLANDLPVDFPSVQVNLVAGKTVRAEDEELGSGDGESARADQPLRRSPSPTRVFELHRYTLPDRIDLSPGQTVQVPFFAGRRIPAERRLLVPHRLDESTVLVQLRFRNDIRDAQPLPEGHWSVYSRASDGDLTFMGESYREAVPTGGTVELDVGAALDIQARRSKVSVGRPDPRRSRETWRVELTSGRAGDARVLVEHRVFGYWAVTEAFIDGNPAEYDTTEAYKITFPVLVPAGKTVGLTYTLEYGF